jgi:hypothetical protein
MSGHVNIKSPKTYERKGRGGGGGAGGLQK